MLSSEDVKMIEPLLQSLTGREAWGAKVGVGSFLLLEFGHPVTVPMKTVDPFVKGAWHLWLYEAAWRIEVGGALRAGSGDTSERKEQLEEAVKVLDGLRLEAISIAPLSCDTIFRFGGDTLLRPFSLHAHDDANSP